MKECPACLECREDDESACRRDGAQLRPSLPGTALLDGKYRLERRLGAGGMGIVFKAWHVGLERTCAVKLISVQKIPDGEFLARFRIEAKALGRLRHPNIVAVTDFGVDPREGGVPYLVMEYLEGRSLQDSCEDAGPMSTDEALPIFESIARAVDYAHERGILHRDLKPANIFLGAGTGPDRAVKILDFGLARLVGGKQTTMIDQRHRILPDVDNDAETAVLGQIESPSAPAESRLQISTVALADPTLTKPGSLMGTLPYMAPETFGNSGAGKPSDVYAFGILIFELLVGDRPFRGSPAEIVHGHLEVPASFPDAAGGSLPEEVREAVLEPLKKDPAQRPRTATEVVTRIRTASNLAAAEAWRRSEIPRRFRLSVVIAMVLTGLCAFLETTPLLDPLEARTVGARFLAAIPHAPDPRLLLVTMDDASLVADPRLLGERADEFGQRLDSVFGAGARAIAIDFLLPEKWSQSEVFSRFVLRHAPSLTLAAYSPPAGKVLGPECLSGLTSAALGPGRAAELFGLVNLEEDRDGVTRTARFSYDDREGSATKTWAAGAVESIVGKSSARPSIRSRPFWIDYRADWTSFQRISWKDLAPTLDLHPGEFKDRLVLVGGDFATSGDDAHRVPHLVGGSREVSGIVLEALIANTILARLPIRNAGIVQIFLVVVLASTVVATTFLCLPSLSKCAIMLLGAIGSQIILAIAEFRVSGTVFPIIGPGLTVVAAALLAFELRTRSKPFPSHTEEVA